MARLTQTPRTHGGPDAREPDARPLRVLLVDRTSAGSDALREALEREGHLVLAPPAQRFDVLRRVRELEPDVVVVDMDAPERDVLDDARRILEEQPKPIVMFVARSDGDSIRLAMQAGVASYVVERVGPERVRVVLEAALARFRELHALRTELAEARSSLAERKLIERAKGILMERRGCSEDDAYRALRQAAMSRNQRLIEVARNVIELSKLL